jgi:hypothetical protein
MLSPTPRGKHQRRFRYGRQTMKKPTLRFVLFFTLLLAGWAVPLLTAQGPLPQPSCIPGDVGCQN